MNPKHGYTYNCHKKYTFFGCETVEIWIFVTIRKMYNCIEFVEFRGILKYNKYDLFLK